MALPASISTYGPPAAILLGALLSAFGALWSTVSQQASRAAQNAQITQKTTEIASLQQQLNASQIAQTDMIATKTAEITELQNQMYGADSYCFIFDFVIRGNHVQFQLRHTGKYSIYDVKLTSYYTNMVEGALEHGDTATDMHITGSGTDLQRAVKGIEYNIGVLGIGQMTMFKEELNETDTHYFSFHFDARSGKWDERFVISARNGAIHSGYRVFRNSKVLIDHADKDLPAELLKSLGPL